jgi:hypothetical protein
MNQKHNHIKKNCKNRKHNVDKQKIMFHRGRKNRIQMMNVIASLGQGFGGKKPKTYTSVVKSRH